MIYMDSATSSLAVILTAAMVTSNLVVFVNHKAVNPDVPSIAFKHVSVQTNGTSAVTVLAAPTAPSSYAIETISVINIDSITHTVALATGFYALYSATLLPGERLEYENGSGWRVFDVNNAIKTVAVATGRNVVAIAADVVNNNASANTIANVTGLAFPVLAGVRYRFKFTIDYTAAVTTTGSRWSITGPASPTRLNYDSDYSLTTTTRTLNTGQSTYNVPAAASASSASTGANIAIIEGFITPSVAGTVTARFASEVASSAITAKAGSYVEYEVV